MELPPELENRRMAAATRIVQARLVAVAISLRRFDETEERAVLTEWERVTFRIYGLGRFDARTKVGEYVRLGWKITNERLAPKDIISELQRIGNGEEYAIENVIKRLYNHDCYQSWSEELRYFLYRYEEHLAK